MSLYTFSECDQRHHLEWHRWPESFQDPWPQGHREDVLSLSETTGLELLASGIQYYGMQFYESQFSVSAMFVFGKLKHRDTGIHDMPLVLITISELHLKFEGPAPGWHEQLFPAECHIVEIPQSSSFALSAKHLCENSGAEWVFTGSWIRATQRKWPMPPKSRGVTIQKNLYWSEHTKIRRWSTKPWWNGD